MIFNKTSCRTFLASVRKIFKETNGQALIVAALALPVIGGAAALAVDVGHAYVAKTSIQTAVDAGARAGAAILADGGSQADATTAATTFANANLDTAVYLANAVPAVSFPTSTSISVSVEHDVSFYFAPLVGIDSTSVSASATATLASVSGVGANSLVPLAIYCNNDTGCAGVLSVGQNYSLQRYCGNFFKDGATGSSCGNTISDGEVFLVGITFDNNNSNAAFRSAVEDGYSDSVSLGQEARALPGNRNGWRSGMTNRLSDGRNEAYVPIISGLDPTTGTYNIQIADFVKVDISSFVEDGSTDTTTLQITQGAVSTTDFADSGEGLDINSVVGVRLSN